MINKLQNFNTTFPILYSLVYGFFIAFFFSYFIYTEYFGITLKILNTLFALFSLALFLYAPKKAILFAGFFIGLLWFYWIGYSFEYQGVGYMLPMVTFGFGIIYMLFFGVLALTHKVYIRALLLFGLSFVEPFDWNWLQIELIFIESYIGILKYQLALVLLSLSLTSYVKRSIRYLPLILLLFSFNFEGIQQEESSLKIKLINTDIKQEDKWTLSNRVPTVKMIFEEIHKAKQENYDVIIFPETIFPMYLSKDKKIFDLLLTLSKSITIVAGSILQENGQNFNITYMFNEGESHIAKKMVLVPFGEYIPLPSFAKKIINDTFFSGKSDFIQASSPTDFIIKGQKFRNAICYEATCQEIYEGDIKYVIASSNNAWFAPSIEPTIQNLLLRFYARKNGVTIYHSTNSKGTGVIQ